MNNKPIGQRIVIAGSTSAGKTVFAKQLCKHYKFKHIELDALYWGPNWTRRSRDDFRRRVAEELEEEKWIVDGHYELVDDFIFKFADTFIYLNYSFPVILWRLTRRTFGRLWRQEELWNGNRESWRFAFSRDSLFLWALTTYRRQQRMYERILKEPQYAHLMVFCFTSPKATNEWVRSLRE